MFRVGQKVVCVDGKFPISHPCDPVEGEIYTVSGVGPFNGFDCVTLFEVDPPIDFHPWLKASRFRPIVSRPTSIEFAHEILRKATRTDEVTA